MYRNYLLSALEILQTICYALVQSGTALKKAN